MSPVMHADPASALPISSINPQVSSSLQILHVPAGAGEKMWVVGDTYTFKLTGAETDNSLFVWEAHVPPQAGPPLHIHHAQKEVYYILEGELEVTDGERTFTANAGSLVYIPAGAVHSFRNIGSTPARMLVWMTPAGFEEFFREVGQRPRQDEQAPLPGPEEMARTIDAATRYSLELRLPETAPSQTG